jgi:ribosomal protein L16 Arg81 hydroxylase
MIDFGVSADEFRAGYFESRPYLKKAAVPEATFAWRDLDVVLHQIDASGPALQLWNGGLVPEDDFTQRALELGAPRRRVDKRRLLEQLRRGATLVINGFERWSPPAARLCSCVARFAEAPALGNAYLSLGGRGTFGKHWDTHDVFAIQLIGRKRWRVFAPTFPLPLTHHSHDRSGQQCPAEPELEVTVEEGDVLYVPRGWWHHVVPMQMGSFHLSVGCYLPTVFDYVVQTSAKYLERQLAARQSFSADDYRGVVAELLANLEPVLADPANAAAFARDSVDRERMNAEFNLALLGSPATALSGTALLSLATFGAPRLEDGTLLVNGVRLSLPPLCRTIVAALSGCDSMSVDELCARVDDAPPDAVRRAVVDLSRQDVVTIQS